MKTRAISLILAACFALAGVLISAGCNTTQGFGKDVKNLGQGIQNKAADKKADTSDE